jgi:hypothetical protein
LIFDVLIIVFAFLSFYFHSRRRRRHHHHHHHHSYVTAVKMYVTAEAVSNFRGLSLDMVLDHPDLCPPGQN